MMLADPERADQERDGAEAEQQGSELAFGGGASFERVRRAADVAAGRVRRVGGRGEQVRDRDHVVLVGADVDLRPVRELLEEVFGDGQGDEHGRVEVLPLRLVSSLTSSFQWPWLRRQR
jgi:hypothetical protein